MTTIYVTHDQVEAMTMGDRVAVMRKGELQQVAPPQELYERPVNLFVGGFIGSPAMNLVEATIERRERLVRRRGRQPDADARRGGRQGAPATRRVRGPQGRPRHPAGEPGGREPGSGDPEDRHIKGVLVLREPLGSEIIAHFEVDAPPALTEDVRELARDVGHEGTVQAPAEGDTKTTMVGRFGPRSHVRSGDVIDVAVDTSAVHLFDLDTSEGIYE